MDKPPYGNPPADRALLQMLEDTRFAAASGITKETFNSIVKANRQIFTGHFLELLGAINTNPILPSNQSPDLIESRNANTLASQACRYKDIRKDSSDINAAYASFDNMGKMLFEALTSEATHKYLHGCYQSEVAEYIKR